MSSDPTGVTGRDREVAEAAAFLDRVASGRAGALVVAGEAGMGKTTLARRIADDATQRGWTVAWSWCWAGEEVPQLWAWRQACSRLGVDLPEGASVADAYPLIAAHVESADPIVFFFDDAHGADEPTLSLVNLLTRSLPQVSVGVVLTVCEEDVAPGSGRARLLDEISRGGKRVELHGIDRAAIEDLLGQRGMHGLPPLVVDSLVSASEGNPFLIGELIAEIDRGGELRRPDMSLGFRVPRGADAVLDRILARLDDDERETLSAAAVVGRTFHASLVAALVQRSFDEVMNVLHRSAEGGAVRVSDALGTFEFSHPLLRELLYTRLDDARRRDLHRTAAAALSDDASRLSERAHHLFKVGPDQDAQEAVLVLAQAADAATAAGATDEAERHRHRARRLARVAGIAAPVSDEAVATSSPRPAASPGLEGTFTREGELWRVGLGDETALMKPSKGMVYLRHLLEAPQREWHALDLVAASGARATVQQATTGPILDPQAKAAYKERLAAIEEELAEATDFNDDAARQRAEEEKRFLLDELGAAVGLGGRDREAGAASERARVASTRAIRAALRRIAAVHPLLSDHLDRTIQTGTFAAYKPDPHATPTWRF